jgi:hypothetical protein
MYSPSTFMCSRTVSTCLVEPGGEWSHQQITTLGFTLFSLAGLCSQALPVSVLRRPSIHSCAWRLA